MEILDLITISSLFLLILFLIFVGYIEAYLHKKSLQKIPIRIHVNGTRGKSSVTRLISAGLRAGGLKTFAKTTGTIPRIINDNGKDVALHRLRSPSIGEQIKLIRFFSKHNPDALVIECMAVNPQYQWISEHKIVQSTLGVITNIRPDHLDEMGYTVNDVALSLSNTIPFNSKIITSEKNILKPLKDIAAERNSTIEIVNEKKVDDEYLNKFPFIEHPENINLALTVCKAIGIKEKIAKEGMLKTVPDPGALFIWKIRQNKNINNFVSAFAANDPDSTIKVWRLIKKRNKDSTCIFLNTRNDRRYRTIQLIELIFKHLKPNICVIRGDNIESNINKYDCDKIKIKVYDMSTSQNEIITYFNSLNKYLIFGIGNMVGWGDEFIKKIKKFKIND